MDECFVSDELNSHTHLEYLFIRSPISLLSARRRSPSRSESSASWRELRTRSKVVPIIGAKVFPAVVLRHVVWVVPALLLLWGEASFCDSVGGVYCWGGILQLRCWGDGPRRD